MATKHIVQALDNAEKLLQVYIRTKDESLLEIIGGLIALARSSAQDMSESPGVSVPDLPKLPPPYTPTTRPVFPDGVYAYAVPFGDSGVSGDKILITTDSTASTAKK
jgi:hypothetical protein